MGKEHITKREIFERIRSIREDIQDDVLSEIKEKLIDLETSVLQDCRIEHKKERTVLCNECYRPLTKGELNKYPMLWKFSGDMYCGKCDDKNECPTHEHCDSSCKDSGHN